MSTPFSKNVYEFIKNKLLTGQLPLGKRVSEFAIAKELGISRSPVREAISHMVSEGLLEKLPGLGAFVKIPNRREIEELFVVREMLESYAVSEATQKITAEQIESLSKLCDALHELAKEISTKGESNAEITCKIIESDLAFHMLVLSIADNQQVIRIIENCRILTVIFSLYQKEFFQLRQVAGIWREHVKILKALKEQNPEQACYWIKRQIQRSRQLSLSSYEKLKLDEKFANLAIRS